MAVFIPSSYSPATEAEFKRRHGTDQPMKQNAKIVPRHRKVQYMESYPGRRGVEGDTSVLIVCI